MVVWKLPIYFYYLGISTVVHYDYTVIRADECVIVHIIAVGTRNGLNRRLIVSLVIACLESRDNDDNNNSNDKINHVCMQSGYVYYWNNRNYIHCICQDIESEPSAPPIHPQDLAQRPGTM